MWQCMVWWVTERTREVLLDDPFVLFGGAAYVNGKREFRWLPVGGDAESELKTIM